MAEPTIVLTLDRTVVVSGEIIHIIGTWDFAEQLPSPARVACYKTIPAWQNIHTNTEPATTGTFELDWTAPDVTTSTEGYFYAILQDPVQDIILAEAIEYITVNPLTPTIASISWSPTGDYVTLSAGAALVEDVVGGGTTQLMLVAVDPAAVVDPPLSDGEAILQIDQEDPFIVAAGDHFRFNDKEWWTLNIICAPESSIITLADEVAQAEKIPKIGDEIQFIADIDWHDQEILTIKWYYAKSLNRCFDDVEDLDWTEFAVGENTNIPAHTFDAEGDEAITFLRVTATNLDGATDEHNTLCGPIFNLWKYMPSWWDQLLEAIHTVNAEDIAHPIVLLSENVAAIPGWTEPPFECPICKQVFNGADSELNYANHLMSHITAFEYGWFGK